MGKTYRVSSYTGSAILNGTDMNAHLSFLNWGQSYDFLTLTAEILTEKNGGKADFGTFNGWSHKFNPNSLTGTIAPSFPDGSTASKITISNQKDADVGAPLTAYASFTSKTIPIEFVDSNYSVLQLSSTNFFNSDGLFTDIIGKNLPNIDLSDKGQKLISWKIQYKHFYDGGNKEYDIDINSNYPSFNLEDVSPTLNSKLTFVANTIDLLKADFIENVNNIVFKTQYGENEEYITLKSESPTTIDHYNFTNWKYNFDGEVKTDDNWIGQTVWNNVEITACYTPEILKVVFIDEIDSNIIKQVDVGYNSNVDAPTPPTHPHKIFDHWDPQTWNPIQANTTIYARYKDKPFENSDDLEYSTTQDKLQYSSTNQLIYHSYE